MNAAKLNRQYSELTARERFALSMNAAGRGDDVEVNRLAGSAPRLAFTATHSWPWIDGFESLSRLVLLELLDFVSQFWQGQALVFRDGYLLALPETLNGPKKPSFSDDEIDLFLEAGNVLAHRFARTLDAWDDFCRGLGIDPRTHWKPIPGCVALELSEALIRASCEGPAPSGLQSQADMARDLLHALETVSKGKDGSR